MNVEKHLSAQFDAELNQVSSMVMEMGGLVEQQVRRAVEAMVTRDADIAQQVIQTETRVNEIELQIDHELVSIIGRRQPTAKDLRLLVAISRSIANLERVGDEATRMARMVSNVLKKDTKHMLPANELRTVSALASDLLRKSLDAFARLDASVALEIIKADDAIDEEYNGFVRKLITYMMEDSSTISSSLNLLFIAKAIERVGDHAKNLAECVIYIVDGVDVRHTTVEDIESQLG